MKKTSSRGMPDLLMELAQGPSLPYMAAESIFDCV